MPDTATVFIVDDDPGVLRAVAIVGKSLGYPVQTFSRASDFLYGYEVGTPGALILDVRMPEMTGLELQKMLADASILLPVIMISGHADVRMAVEAMSRGAFTFMEKPFRMPELQKCIQAAVQKSVEDQAKLTRDDDLRTRLASLTVKEKEVLDLLLAGRSNKEIAAQLKISLRAVEDRRSRLMKRMRTASALELVGEIKSLNSIG